MRVGGADVTQDEFDAALTDASLGFIVSDTGLPDDVERALDAVRAAAPDPPADLLKAARDAFARHSA